MARRQSQALCQTVLLAKCGFGNFLDEFNPVRPSPDRPFARIDDLVAVSPAAVFFLRVLDNTHSDAPEALLAVVIA